MDDSVVLAEGRGLVVERRGEILVGPVDFTIGPREFWGIVGPNGAGKSTLLRAIAGLEPITRGTLDVATNGERTRIGLLFQHHDFVPEIPFTVCDVVSFGRSANVGFGWIRREQDRQAVDRAMELLEIGGMRSRLYRELSGGERQKAQLARLIAQEADLLLLDEPAAGLDLDWQERLKVLVMDLHQKSDVAVVMVTHEVHHLPPCCDRVLLLRGGQPLATGTPQDVFTPERLSELYGCRMEVTRRGNRYFAQSLGADGEPNG